MSAAGLLRGARSAATARLAKRTVVFLLLVFGLASLAFSTGYGPRAAALIWDGFGVLPNALGFGHERTYLILIQDTGEIRPTGGFIGSYGIVRVSGGRLGEFKFGDTYDLDWPYYESGRAQKPVAMFARYLPESTFWALRDANIWPDYPTSARQAASFAIEEGVADRIDGVIALTPGLATRILKVLGPVTVPGFNESVTAENFVERIRYYQSTAQDYQRRKAALGDDPEVGQRKLFMLRLVKAVVEKLSRPDPGMTAGIIAAMRDAVREKDLLVYFADPSLQSVVERRGVAGEMKPAAGDYLWIVDMNLSAAKDNFYVEESAQYAATLSSEGLVGELAITYDYRRTGDLFLWTIKRGYYGDYLRVYVPLGSVLLASDGTDEPVQTFTERDKTGFETFLRIKPGTTRTARLRYRIPLELPRSGQDSTYILLIQKQPGSKIDPLHVSVALPPGSTVVETDGARADGPSLQFDGPLKSDLTLKGTFQSR